MFPQVIAVGNRSSLPSAGSTTKACKPSRPMLEEPVENCKTFPRSSSL
eukprot:CAMPEP_0204060214 /NCGR_PEP_ID=MMETSP0360-20130528/139490_1 /ASSEMBLY_ACC=CAM_ASM_000342 /TAXON_ID=268821 /ORGANISM="Scrippsiella Hangoei, Strain SHTV-5" /LENGTH=47 /DNA_ID= /DNA_START= /DNA_END= /DNA_ORIENTATION=